MNTRKLGIAMILSFTALITFLGILIMTMGASLEQYPTPEQIEKVRIIGGMFVFIGIFSSAVSLLIYNSKK